MKNLLPAYLLKALGGIAFALCCVMQAGAASPMQFHVYHLLVNSQVTAAQIAESLRAAPNDTSERLSAFEAAARANSLDPGSAPKGGDLGFADPGIYVPPFADAIRNAAPWEIVGPVQTVFGWHLLMVVDRREAPTAAPAPGAIDWNAVNNSPVQPADPLGDLYRDVAPHLSQIWKFSSSDSGSIYFIDSNLAKPQGGRATFWIFRAFVSSQTSVITGKAFRSMKSLMVVDCPAQAAGTQQSLLFERADGSGEVIYSSPYVRSPELSPLIPDSTGEQMARDVCARVSSTTVPSKRTKPTSQSPSTKL